MIYVKKHNNGVLAACDSDILGKKFSEGNKELHVREEFYKGELVQKQDFLEEFLNADNVNLVGEKTIAFASEKTYLNVMKIQNIPYSIIFKVK